MDGFEAIIGVNPWTALFTFLNMLITFFLLKKFLFGPVQKMIASRQKEVDDMYSAAETAKSEAETMREEYSRHLASAREERDEIVREAVQRAGKREQEIISEAQSEADAIREKAHSDIEQEKKKALNEVKNEISGIAMGIAEKVCEKEIDSAQHSKLVNDFIRNIGDAS